MKPATLSSRASTRRYSSDRNQSASTAGNYALKVAVLYHDDLSRDWAREVHTLARQLVGKDAIRTTWWNIRELNEPAVLAGAVSKAMHSDIIVVAMPADAALPLAFYYWADAWLPHRSPEPGALVALIGLSEQSQAKSLRTREYLRILSRRGGLDFLFDERPLPAAAQACGDHDASWRDAITGAVLRTMAVGGAWRFPRQGRIKRMSL
jgi:hypothetical protein